MNILAFESSCDETAVAVVRDGRTLLSDERENDENNTLYKYGCECCLPGISHTKDNGVGKVSIQSHTRSQNKRIV